MLFHRAPFLWLLGATFVAHWWMLRTQRARNLLLLAASVVFSLAECGLDAGGTCSGLCPNLSDVCVQDSITGACGCVPGPCRALGGIGSCAGTCPPPAICTLLPVPGGCECVIPCEGSGAPPCSPPCSFPQACVFDPSAGVCGCGP